jgi:hypothetical protein
MGVKVTAWHVWHQFQACHGHILVTFFLKPGKLVKKSTVA